LIPLTILVALSISACSTMTVESDWDHDADFSSYKSFAWVLPENADARANQIVENRIKSAVITNMEAKKLVEDNTSPDLHVTYMVNVQEQLDVSTTTYGYWRGSAVGDVDVYAYDQGTLLIDIIDVKKNQLVWRGTGTGVLASDAGSQANVDKAVQGILAQYPPQ